MTTSHVRDTVRTPLAVALGLSLCIGLAACRDADPHAGHDHGPGGHVEQVEQVEDPHDHSAFVRHGGTLIEVGDHAAMLEVVLDHDDRSVSVFIMDADGAALSPDAPPFLNFMHEGAPAQVVGAQIDAAATDGAWVFRHDAFAGEPEHAVIRLSVSGKSHMVELAHDH